MNTGFKALAALAVVLFITTGITSRAVAYDNASLSGPWIFDPGASSGNLPLGMIFNGSGSVYILSFRMAGTETYSVQYDGSFTLNTTQMGVWTGQLNSPTTGTWGIAGGARFGTMKKVQDPSACAGNWAGTFDQTSPENLVGIHSIDLSVDATGEVTSFTSPTISGLDSGDLFCDDGVIVAFFNTGEDNNNRQIFFSGTHSADTLSGDVEVDTGENPSGTFFLTTVPEPSAALLQGVALLCLGVTATRRRKN